MTTQAAPVDPVLKDLGERIKEPAILLRFGGVGSALIRLDFLNSPQEAQYEIAARELEGIAALLRDARLRAQLQVKAVRA